MISHPSDDQVLDLILDLLPREREEQLLDHMSRCPACERRMLRQAAEKERLASGSVPADMLRAMAEARERQAREAPQGSHAPSMIERARGWFGSRRPIRVLLPVGGGVAVLALLAFVLVSRERPAARGPEATWLPAGAALVQRGGSSGSAISGRLADGLDAYNRHDLAEAIRNLEEATVPLEQEAFRRLYLASALTLSGRDAEAVRTLHGVTMEYLPEPWATEGYWTLLVALRGSGRRESADSLRQVLGSYPGEIGERVRRLR